MSLEERDRLLVEVDIPAGMYRIGEAELHEMYAGLTPGMCPDCGSQIGLGNAARRHRCSTKNSAGKWVQVKALCSCCSRCRWDCLCDENCGEPHRFELDPEAEDCFDGEDCTALYDMREQRLVVPLPD